MVKHQRRSHQRGVNGAIEFDGSDTDSEGESPSTPKSGNAIWTTAPMQGFGTGLTGGPMGHAMYHGAPYPISAQNPSFTTRPQDFSGAPPPVMDHNPIPMPQIHRNASMPHTGPFYVTDQNNPGVATMNTNVIPSSHFVPRNHGERPQLEIPFSTGSLNPSLQSSPNTFSPVGGRSPAATDSFYTHQPTQQQATYPLANASSANASHDVMMQHHAPPQQHQQPQHHQAPNPQPSAQSHPMSEQSHIAIVKQSPPPQSQQFQSSQTPSDEHQWYTGYQPLMPVSNMQIPPTGPYSGMGTGMYHDAWACAKMGYETEVGPLPSSRFSGEM